MCSNNCREFSLNINKQFWKGPVALWCFDYIGMLRGVDWNARRHVVQQRSISTEPRVEAFN